MLRRKLRRNLGVSTVIANLLMIMITLSLAAILVAWAGTSYGAFTGGSSLFFQQRGLALQERFVVEEAYFLCPSAPTTNVCSSYSGTRTGYVDLFVRNVGVEQIDITAIYANGAAYDPVAAAQGSCIPPTGYKTVPVYVGTADPAHPNVCEFKVGFTSPYLTWTTGTVFTIVVASLRGNQATQTTRAP